jgi:hypothetical protein
LTKKEKDFIFLIMSLTEEKKRKLQSHLKDCMDKFSSLRKADYVPPITKDSFGEDYESPASETKSAEFEFDDAYTDPVEAIRTFIEILQVRGELNGIKRDKIITTEKAKEIMSRLPNKQYSLLKNGLINAEIFSAHGNELIVSPIAKPDEVILKVI